MFVNKIEIQAKFFIFNTNPRFPPFLLYVRCKSGVTFIWRSFRDVDTFGFVKCVFGFVKCVPINKGKKLTDQNWSRYFFGGQG